MRVLPASTSVTELDDDGLELLRERYYVGVEEAAITGLVVVVTMLLALWPHSDQAGLATWAILMGLALPAPAVIKRWHPELQQWFRVLVPVEIGLGVIWASIAVLAMPTDATWQAMLGAVLVGVLVASSVTSSQFLSAHLAFSGPFAATSIVGFVVHGDGAARIMIWVLLVAWGFGVSLALEQRRLQLDLVATLRRNSTLLASLQREHEATAATNRALESAVHKADRLARTDHLTQIANRQRFDELLDDRLAALQRGEARYVTLVFLDLDNFKYVNDALGHRAGDMVLVTVARRMREVSQPGELVARLGGDELLVLSRGYDPLEVGRRYEAVFAESFVIGGREVSLSASIGVCTIDAPISRDEFLRRADIAQDEAKRTGGNRFVVHDQQRSSTPKGWSP